MDELRDLYQEVILDHGRNPRNCRHLEHASCRAQGNNPMCGDRVTVYLTLDGDGTIEDAAFEGRGCAISMASASMMTEVLKGKTARDADRLFEAFQALCTGEAEDLAAVAESDPDAAERLLALSGVRAFPVRVKCATLPWHTMKAAVTGGSDQEVTTEV